MNKAFVLLPIVKFYKLIIPNGRVLEFADELDVGQIKMKFAIMILNIMHLLL